MNNKYNIIEAVSKECESTHKIIIGCKRTKRASYARDICAFIMHHVGHSHDDISRTLNRDRSSVTHMIRRVKNRIKEPNNQGRLLQSRVRDILDNRLNMPFIDINE